MTTSKPTPPSTAADIPVGATPPKAEEAAHEGAFCPRFHHAVEVIGRRWTGVVLRAMLQGATRYSDIRDAVPALSDKMLVERLKELEQEGILRRTVLPTTPVRVEYHLTEKGAALNSAVIAMAAWADKWVGECGKK